MKTKKMVTFAKLTNYSTMLTSNIQIKLCDTYHPFSHQENIASQNQCGLHRGIDCLIKEYPYVRNVISQELLRFKLCHKCFTLQMSSNLLIGILSLSTHVRTHNACLISHKISTFRRNMDTSSSVKILRTSDTGTRKKSPHKSNSTKR